MNNDTLTHPKLERLLLFADGEAEESVRSHLESCEQCANWYEDLQRGEALYRENAHSALKNASEPPPYAWADLNLRMKSLDLEPKPTAPRLLPVRPQPQRIRWGAIAASVIAAFAIGQWWFGQQVSAAELLRRASEQRVVSPGKRTSIEIRTRAGSVIRPALWSKRSNTRPVSQVASGMQTLFESARYDWEDPLSAQAFAAWRESLPDRHDTVRKLVTAKQEDAYEVRTTTSHGPLAEAILTLRTIDLRPVRETLQFRDRQLVEITEVTRAEEAVPVDPSIQPNEEPRLAKTIVEPVTAAEELAVWEALHRAGADAGEPVEIDRNLTTGRIVVTALGLSPARRAAVEHAMTGIGRVEMRFEEPQQIRASSRSANATEQGPSPPLQSKLEARFGGAQGAEDFIDNLLEATESSMVRAHAIRKLAERFPTGTLDAESGKRLESLVSDHLHALETARDRVVKSASEIAIITRPIPNLAPDPWQTQAEGLVQTTQKIDSLLTRLLAARSPAGSEASLLSELDGALASWQASVSAVRAALGRNR